jgi:DNA-binding GntR family transcriptional regulator
MDARKFPGVTTPSSTDGPTKPPPNTRNTTVVVHRALRDAILRSEIPEGSWLSQVQIAKRFGVSRGPVREALRLLQREGLIEAEINHRARVSQFSIDDLEQLYATRIVTEALSLNVSVPRFSDEELAELKRLLHQLDELAGVDVDRWEDVHRQFHLALVAHAGERLLRMIEQSIDHSERYRRVYITQGPRAWSIGATEHHEIVDACLDRDATAASALLARHLSRTALTVFMLVAPEHNPELIRMALRQTTHQDPPEIPEQLKTTSF